MSFDFLNRTPDDEMRIAPLAATDNMVDRTGFYINPTQNEDRKERDRKGWAGASGAASCLKKRAYQLAGVEADPIGPVSLNSMNIGSAVHAMIQAHVVELGDKLGDKGYKAEETFELPEHEIMSWADLTRYENNGKPLEVTDIKTTNPVAHKMKRQYGGPELGNIIQNTIAAIAIGAPECRLAYIAVCAPSKRDIPKGLSRDDVEIVWAEWTWKTEDAAHLVDIELEQRAYVKDQIRDDPTGESVPRFIPGSTKGTRVVEVPKEDYGQAVTHLYAKDDAGKPQLLEVDSAWQCGYCGMRKHCRAEQDRLEALRNEQLQELEITYMDETTLETGEEE